MDIVDKLPLTYSWEKWKNIGIKKRSGICIPLFSIRSLNSVGIGDFSDLKYLVDFCEKTKNTILQVLPLNYAGYDNCPYNAISSFALDPVYISLSDFISEKEINSLQSEFPAGKNNRCNYSARVIKLDLLKEIFTKNFENICSDNHFYLFVENTRYWLDDFSIYKVLKKVHNDLPWYQWEDKYVRKCSEDMNKIVKEYKKEILFEKWVQYICYKQLLRIKDYAKKKQIFLMGDLPVLPARDSADVWSKRDIFDLKLVAGAPPDMYSAYGQRWGMPVYDREKLRADGFRYIVEKLKYLGNFFDMIRVDHVLGLFRIWAIPVDDPEENHGLNGFFIPEDESTWKVHGKEILTAMIDSFNGLLCAEDLGVVPVVCPELLWELGIPGYEVQRWKKNYQQDCSFVSAQNYRQLAISSLSTHDTSFWLDWYKNEAGTVDEELFLLRCRFNGIAPEEIIDKIFEKNVSGRLRWKDGITATQISRLTGRVSQDILQIYRETFEEKEKVELLLGIKRMDDELTIVKKAIEFILSTSSIFSINLLTDLLCLDQKIASEIGGLRINKPGTTGHQNWSFAFSESLEEILEMDVIGEIKDMVEKSGR
ncbi:MAG: 4-alpha-glucanotransferase [Candidatus Omnitrophica bacterium]|nr:4-alpha-glucanotransferase [Candidatus Omnitrophota bacterium]